MFNTITVMNPKWEEKLEELLTENRVAFVKEWVDFREPENIKQEMPSAWCLENYYARYILTSDRNTIGFVKHLFGDWMLAQYELDECLKATIEEQCKIHFLEAI